jgi:Icc-related predicted phosphoesterase
MRVRIVAISDTHGRHRSLEIPAGDVLVHAGDLSMRGEPEVLADLDDFLGSQPHAEKLVIAGNHDFSLQDEPEETAALFTNCTYLFDEAALVAGLRVYGSPWQPWHHDWAFNLRRGPEIRAVWDRIPADTDLLVTHGPPAGILDRTRHGLEVGCEDLLRAVERVRPKAHVFGHIHEAPGRVTVGETLFVNACSCDLTYRAVRAPVVFDLEL